MKMLVTLLIGFLSSTVLASSYAEDHFKDQVRIVNFWAVWCDACKQELKEFEQELVNTKIKLVLVNLDSDFDKAKSYLNANHKFSKDVLLVHDKGNNLADKYELSAFPTTFIVSKNNEITKVFKGYNAKESKVKEMITEVNRLSEPSK